jgi:metal-sulfur cluster biosynthetic enzyme
MPTREDVVEALRQVEDPELGMDIVDLGLMYDVKVDGPKVHVLFTLTSMGCPVGPMIEQQIEEVTHALPGVEEVVVAGEDVRRRQVHSRFRLTERSPVARRR